MIWGAGAARSKGERERRMGKSLVAHLSRHLNDRLDKRGVGDSVGHREDGSDRGHMVDHGLNCVGKDGGGVGSNGVCENGGRVGEKRGRVCGYGGGGGWASAGCVSRIAGSASGRAKQSEATA